MKEKFDYLAQLSKTEDSILLSFQLSINIGKRVVPSKREEIASQIFTRNCWQLGTILKTLPHSSHWGPVFNYPLWDYSSSCSLIRTIIENYLAFHYYCTENLTEEERTFRYLLFDVVPLIKRIYLLRTHHSNSDISLSDSVYYHEYLEMQKIVDLNIKEIKSNPIFKKLPDKFKDDILKGRGEIYLNNSQLSKNAGIGVNYLKSVNSYLSSYVHFSGYSISQLMGTINESPDSYNLYFTLSQYLFSFNIFLINDFTNLFIDQKQALPKYFQDEYNFWKGAVQDA